jgi:PPM family protein phosphatase
MNYSIGAKTDVGQVREGNEDSYLVDEPLFVVADGMGGHLAGDVASSTAVEVISEFSGQASADDPQTLADLIRAANAAIWEKALEDPTLRGMGTTCTLVLLDGATAHIAHVGDSRAYLLRDGNLQQVTEDHTLVARMVKEGRLRAEEAEHHPQRSIITRALGVDADVDVDLGSLELVSGDRLMLCSDGLSSMIDSVAIETTLEEQSDPQAAAEELVGLANAAGGEDNITVVIVDVGAGGRSARRTPTAISSAGVAPVEPAQAGTGRRWVKRVAISLVVLALLGGGAFGLIQYLRGSSWYVGVGPDDSVTIFKGRAEDLFGIDMDEEVTVTDLKVTDLPQNLRDNVRNGRTADSQEAAEEIVADLEQRAQEFEEETTPVKPSPVPQETPTPNDPKGKRKKN